MSFSPSGEAGNGANDAWFDRFSKPDMQALRHRLLFSI
jgi:hypothetical protein